jgi:hypothetical protein
MRASCSSGLVQLRILASVGWVRIDWCSKQIYVGAHVDFATLSACALCSGLIERQVLLAYSAVVQGRIEHLPPLPMDAVPKANAVLISAAMFA